jgi:hypothetical protein
MQPPKVKNAPLPRDSSRFLGVKRLPSVGCKAHITLLDQYLSQIATNFISLAQHFQHADFFQEDA